MTTTRKPRRIPRTPKQKVLRKFPSARCVKALGCYYIGYIRATDGGPTFIGGCTTPAAAWASAASRLKG
jgi:hypothetical protein